MIREEKLLIGTKEEFEVYFYQTLGVMDKSDKIIFDDYCMVLSDSLSIKNQLYSIENKNPSFGIVSYLKYTRNEDNTIDAKMTSHKIWIQPVGVVSYLKCTYNKDNTIDPN